MRTSDHSASYHHPPPNHFPNNTTSTSSSASSSTSSSASSTSSSSTVDHDELSSAFVNYPSFILKADSLRVVFSLISSIYELRKDQYAVMAVNAKGLRISIENISRSMYATALLNRELFSVFDIDGIHMDLPGNNSKAALSSTVGEIAFRINLRILLECLNAYGGASLVTTAVVFQYSGQDALLRLLLEENGVITECSIATVNLTDDVAMAIATASSHHSHPNEYNEPTEESTGLGKRSAKPATNPVSAGQLAAVAYGHGMDYEGAFRSYPVVAKFVATSNVLHDAFREMIDQPGADTLWLSLSSVSSLPSFRLHTTSSFGTCTIDFDRRSEAFKSFDISLLQQQHNRRQDVSTNATPNETTLDGDVSHSYRLNLFGPTVRTLDTATETFLRVNSVGMLHMAHRIAIDSIDGNPVAAFVTFCFMPDDEDMVNAIENNIQEFQQSTVPDGNNESNKPNRPVQRNDKRQRRDPYENGNHNDNGEEEEEKEKDGSRYDSPSYDDDTTIHHGNENSHHQRSEIPTEYDNNHNDDDDDDDENAAGAGEDTRSNGFVRNVLLLGNRSLTTDTRSIATGIIDNEEEDDFQNEEDEE